MIQINLLPQARRQAMARRARVRACVAASACYCIAGVLGGAAFWASGPSQTLANSGVSSGRATRDEIEADLTDLRARAMELSRRESRLSQIELQPRVGELTRVLVNQLSDGVVLESLSMRRQTPQASEAATRGRLGAGATAPAAAARGGRVYVVDLGGLARSQADVTAFVLRLEALGLFDAVSVLESGEADASGSLARFRVQCRATDAEPERPASPVGAGEGGRR